MAGLSTQWFDHIEYEEWKPAENEGTHNNTCENKTKKNLVLSWLWTYQILVYDKQSWNIWKKKVVKIIHGATKSQCRISAEVIPYIRTFCTSNWLENEMSVKSSQLHAFCSWAIVHCYIEFKLTYLKKLKLFSIRVK